jgi:hypothetical protein
MNARVTNLSEVKPSKQESDLFDASLRQLTTTDYSSVAGGANPGAPVDPIDPDPR